LMRVEIAPDGTIRLEPVSVPGEAKVGELYTLLPRTKLLVCVEEPEDKT